MKTIIHINQHNIKFNTKHGKIKPVITVKQGKKNIYTNSVKILGPCEVVYSVEKPLNCGARVWLETESEVVCDNPLTYQESQSLQCPN